MDESNVDAEILFDKGLLILAIISLIPMSIILCVMIGNSLTSLEETLDKQTTQDLSIE